jgi:transposase-like protein
MESTKDARIQAAMAMLDSQSTLNYAEAARAFDIHPMTLARRYRGQTVSREEANSNFRQCLNSTQEDTLLSYINSLTDRHIPATS